MKKLLFLALIVGLTGPSFAGVTYMWNGRAIDIVATVELGYIGGSQGGPFGVTVKDGNLQGYGGPAWCVESEKRIAFRTPYLASIDRVAYYGGPDASGNDGDELSEVTEHIYRHNKHNTADADQVSGSIYFAEDEPAGVAGAAYTAAVLAGKSKLNAASDAVAVMNLWTVDDKQDDGQGNITYYLKDWQSQVVGVVPAPGAVLLGGLGTGLVGFMRRRFMA